VESTSPAPGAAGGARPPAWGRLTSVRDALLRMLARPSRSAAPQAKACTIVKLDRLGDFVLALGAVRELVAHYGPEHCRLIISPSAAPLVAREFSGVERIVLPAFAERLRDLLPVRRRWRQALSRLACDDLICLRHQSSAYRDMVVNWLPARRRIVLHGPFGDAPVVPIVDHVANLTYPERSTPGLSRELEAHRVTVAAAIRRDVSLAAIIPTLAPRGPFPPNRGQRRRVVIAPFAGIAIRDLPAHLMPALAAAWRTEPEMEIVLTGTAAQIARMRTLAGHFGSLPTPPTIDESPLPELIELLSSADLVISAESAPAHLAVALDRPTIALLGGGHHGLLAPWQRSDRQVWLQHKLPCYGCDWICHHDRPLCLTEIRPEQVIATAQTMLRLPP